MTKYQKTLDYLFSLQRVGIKLGLDNILTLLGEVGNPHQQWPAIHIAGTNGKGSTAAILESILLKSGYKVGLYTSPHLIDFTERMRVNRVLIPQQEVIDFTEKLRPTIENITPSFFEVTTAMAFWYFANQKIDIAVVETGMGGRLDSTRVVNPLISVITPVDFDHQFYLGDTIEEIAAEKAGIIKEGVTCITSNRNSKVLNVLSDVCQKKDSSFVKIFDNSSYQLLASDFSGSKFNLEIDGNFFKDLSVNLPGEYQIENVVLAAGTILNLQDKIDISGSAFREGLTSVQWKGRMDLISTNPNIIIDVSHNPCGVEKTLSFVRKFFPKEKITAITFLQEDKNFQKIGELFTQNVNETWIVNLKLGKPLNPQNLLDAILNDGGNASIIQSLENALTKIYQSNNNDYLWLIIGSHYLAGEAYQTFRSL